MAVLSGWPTQVRAQEQVSQFKVEASLSAEGRLNVTETIVYDFGDLERHGIYRYIPYKYRDTTGRVYRLNLRIEKILDGTGRPVPYETSQEGGNLVYKIGDPDTLLTGQQAYKLSYSLSPIVRQASNYDYLSWDVVGEGWTVPVRQTELKLLSPTSVGSAQCYSSEACQVQVADRQLNLTASDIQPGQAATLEVHLPPGSVAQYARPTPAWIEAIPFLSITAAVLVVLSALLTLLYWRFKDRRARRRQTIIPLYEAPGNMTPGEIGLLDENRSGMSEITASLIDVARRGYLKIEQTKPKGWLSKAQYKLHKLKSFDEVEPPVRKLLDALFASADQVQLHQVNKVKVAASVDQYHKLLASNLKNKGYYASSPSFWKWTSGRFGRLTLIVGALVTGLSVIYLVSTREYALGALGWGIYGLGVGLSYPLWRIKRRTDQGIARWRDIAGFKWFLTVAEKDRIKFHEAPAKTPQLFSSLLAYAVALGVEREWAKQFEGIDLGSETGWYYSPTGNHFSGVALASDLSSSFSPVVASNLVSGSSSTSSGGFSGGGFGGGGGGSW